MISHRLLSSLSALFTLQPAFADAAVLSLRKALFIRTEPARQVAASGLLLLLQCSSTSHVRMLSCLPYAQLTRVLLGRATTRRGVRTLAKVSHISAFSACLRVPRIDLGFRGPPVRGCIVQSVAVLMLTQAFETFHRLLVVREVESFHPPRTIWRRMPNRSGSMHFNTHR